MRERTNWWINVILYITAGTSFSAGPLSAPAHAQMPQKSVRSLSGTVTDGHEPIRKAVVQMRNQDNNELTTYITDNDGHYNFKRLNGDADYQVWVEFRGHRSPTRTISKFDSHMQKVINFTVRTF
jgi:hypothetical protein